MALNQLEGLKVISFDLDDTLWDGTEVLLRAEQAMLDWFAQYAPRVLSLSPQELREAKTDFAQRHRAVAHRMSTLRMWFLKDLLGQFNYSEHMAEACFQAFYQTRLDVTLFEGVEETLAELAPHFTLVAVTNGNADVYATPIGKYFEFALTAEEFERPKPHPDMFEDTLTRTCIKPEQVLHVGDHPVHDVQGAYDMGMKVCWVNRKDATWKGVFDPHLIVSHVRELKELATAAKLGHI